MLYIVVVTPPNVMSARIAGRKETINKNLTIC